MWLTSLLQSVKRGPECAPRPAPSSTYKRRAFLPRLEQLEDRTVPADFTAGSVAELIADINAANAAGGSNTITLVGGATFKLNAVNNFTHGANGLPVIASGDNLTIVGNGDSIERTTGKSTPAFRLFDVAAGASLTLQNLTLQGGLAVGFYAEAHGGAIYSQGTLALSGVTVQNNTAQGAKGSGGNETVAAGGGIWSSGSLIIQDSIIQNNQAIGGDGVSGGESGSPPGAAAGGGLYLSGGMVSLLHTTVTRNSAKGGKAASTGHGLPKTDDGVGEGGGLYIAAAASVCLDAFTQANVINNSTDSIIGAYTVC